jgi:hypothetical protein
VVLCQIDIGVLVRAQEMDRMGENTGERAHVEKSKKTTFSRHCAGRRPFDLCPRRARAAIDFTEPVTIDVQVHHQ